MNKEQARLLYETDVNSGYSPEEAKSRLAHFAQTGIALPDPTAKYWPALVHQESGGNQGAVSPKGATGVAQVMPATGPEAASLAGLEWDPVAFKNDPVYNAKLGRAYFRKQMSENGNDPAKALAAYNAGPGALRKAKGDISQLPQETQNYVPSIMNRADQGMQPDMDSPEAIAQAQDALMTPRDKARKAYEDALSNGATPEQAKQAVMQFVQQAAPAPAPVAAQPQQAPVEQPAPQAADPMVRRLSDVRPSDSSVQAQQLQGNMGQRFEAGVNNSLSGMDRGARKLIGMLTGNDQAVKNSEAETQKVRDVYSKYDPVGSGFSAADAGKLAGDTGSFALAPGGGASTLGRVLAGAGTGAVQGALQPTTAGESVGTNAAVGGTVGGTLSGAGALLRNTIGRPDADRALSAALLRKQGVGVPVGQEYNSPIGSLLRKAGGAEGSGAQADKSLTSALAKSLGIGDNTDVTNASLEANLRRAGGAIGSAHADSVVTPDRGFFKDILEIGRKYQLSGPKASGDETGKMIDHLLELSKPGRQITGEEYQALRTGLSANSVTGSAAQKEAMGDMKRTLDRIFEEQNPKPELPGLRSEYRLSKILRSGSGVPAEGFTAKALRNRVESAAGKGQVNSDARTMLNETAGLMPSARLGGDAVLGAGDESGLRSLERPSMLGALSAIMRTGAAPMSRGFDKGHAQKAVNDEVTRKALANLLRGIVIPPATPKGEQ